MFVSRLRALASTLALVIVFATAPALAQQPFFDQALEADAVRIEAQIAAEVTAEIGRPAGPAQRFIDEGEAALRGGNAREALASFATATLADRRSYDAWLGYARASRRIAPTDWSERYQLQERAAAAAYRAYLLAPDGGREARALAELGEAQAWRQSWRPAIDAYRASIDRVAEPRITARYEELRAAWGFRILGYDVDSDSASPRACFNFSEPLRARFDYAPFVVTAGAADVAVTAEDRQLCVDGLRFGERYSIVLRRGLPSAIGEDLLAAGDYEIYVRDRTPQVRFTGRNYVLPRLGQEGIPVVSVNTQTALIDIERIGDRGLLGATAARDFLGQLRGWRAQQIRDERGVRVWSGELDITPETNREVVTAFPVLDAVGALEPGVYVMTARVKGLESEDETWRTRATQWFVVSDLGLTAMSAPDGVHVLVRSLADASPLAGVTVELIALNNEVLGSVEADENGWARFGAGLSRGSDGLAPALVTARLDDDYGFVDLLQSAFDLSDRGVTGRPAPGPLEAYVFPERGVYRSGETVHLTALLRDSKGEAAANLPLTLVLRRPDGVEDRRVAVTDQGLGGRAHSFSLLGDAMRGTWRVSAHVDPAGPAVGESSFIVEDYVPERLALTLTPQTERLAPGEEAAIAVQADYLFGAPGAGLAVTGEVSVTAAPQSGVPGLEGYAVGLADEYVETFTAEIEGEATTDAQGAATFVAPVPATSAARPLQARVAVRVSEPGGRGVERSLTLPILPDGPVLAIRKTFGELAEGAQASFDIVAARPSGERIGDARANWTLYRVERRYQWFRSEGSWRFEPVTTTSRVATGAIDLAAGEPARVSAPVSWGSYRLDVTAQANEAAPASVSFQVGWSGDATAETPDLLDLALDRQAYAAGETMRVALNPRFSGEATLLVVSDTVRLARMIDVEAGENVVEIPVEADWGAGAYLVALAHRPLDASARRQPGRALGLAWFSIDREERTIAMEVETPALARPGGPLELPITLSGLAPGEEAYVTLAAVDVGILNLTRHQSPDPTAYFLGQKWIAAAFRDVYGYLIDGMQGVVGAVRSGGDFAPPAFDAPPPDQEPLARYSGVVRVDEQGRATVTFDLPPFNGTVRVMGVAWSRDRVGQVSADVVVRDPVVIAGTTPRFLNVGDRSRLHLQFDNPEAPAGEYALDIDIEGPLLADAAALTQTVTLTQGGRASVVVPITAAGPGRALVTARLTGGELDISRTFGLPVQAGTGALVRRDFRRLEAGGSLVVTRDLLADILPGTGRVSVSVSPLASLDVPGLLQALDRYAYGCSEQIVSQALPLLYLSDLEAGDSLAPDADATGRIERAIAQVLARQNSQGAFGLWNVGFDQDVWLDAYVADFLTRASERGFTVPRRALDQALDALRNFVANTTEVEGEDGAALAYAAYVLARNGRPVMGDLRYLADTRIGDFETPLARAQIAAGLALLGDRGRAERAFDSAVTALRETSDAREWRADYGSRLRDGAGMLVLVSEAGLSRASISPIAAVIERERAAQPFTSTQEQAWMVLAAQAVQADAQAIMLEVGGVARSGAYYGGFDREGLGTEGVRIVNRGEAELQVALTVTGDPVAPEPAQSRGYEVQRSYYRLDGTQVDPSRVAQNDRLVAVLRITEPESTFARLLVVDRLPAGFEIDNPALVDGTQLAALPWLRAEDEIAHVEYRDDRFVAAFNRRPGQSPFITLAYVVRAVAPGTYVHPAALAEDMYRPERFGRTAFGSVEVTGRAE
ncbi:MAG: alpha-2-macroglobulin family protein [Salinarimonadaceae bacterium]|nr:MAG: alpha-2-macroglobulin family protein [Salinarimonadaceae bacterium]